MLLIPGQTESWWGYAGAIPTLAERFRVPAVDLRGQGRSSRTPGRYTLYLMGNDLVRLIDGVVGRPMYVSGLSSGGVLSAWLSASAKPGQVLAAHDEDPPLFSSELVASFGQGTPRRSARSSSCATATSATSAAWGTGRGWSARWHQLPAPIRFVGAALAGAPSPRST